MSKIETEILVFAKGDQIATIVTDGTTHYLMRRCQVFIDEFNKRFNKNRS